MILVLLSVIKRDGVFLENFIAHFKIKLDRNMGLHQLLQHVARTWVEEGLIVVVAEQRYSNEIF